MIRGQAQLLLEKIANANLGNKTDVKRKRNLQRSLTRLKKGSGTGSRAARYIRDHLR